MCQRNFLSFIISGLFARHFSDVRNDKYSKVLCILFPDLDKIKCDNMSNLSKIKVAPLRNQGIWLDFRSTITGNLPHTAGRRATKDRSRSGDLSCELCNTMTSEIKVLYIKRGSLL